MANNNILDRYGIKEVADVTFYKLENGKPTAPVLYLDTLKVSTIEQTAESTSARGGKGNPELIVWDYGKEITVTLEDALFSPKSMALMFGAVDTDNNPVVGEDISIIKRVIRRGEIKLASNNNPYFIVHNQKYDLTNTTSLVSSVKFYDDNGSDVTTSVNGSWVSDAYTYAVADLKVTSAYKIEISPDTFPGTYYITGDTYARSEEDGTDEFFQFIIPKAKVTSEVTLTMEAEGDPSTFSMNLKVLRPKDQPMMELVKYDYLGGEIKN